MVVVADDCRRSVHDALGVSSPAQGMTLTELRYIVAVARERHFRHAAEACFVSQPTLSVAVRKLEDELGVTLFERANNEVSLTPIGARIVEQASRVLDQVNALKHLARQGDDPLSSPLKLGTIFTIAPYLLPSLIPALHRLAPNMPLLLEENFTHKLAESLRQGDLDVILIALPFDEPGVEGNPSACSCRKATHGARARKSLPQIWLTRICCCWEPGIVFAIMCWKRVPLWHTAHLFRECSEHWNQAAWKPSATWWPPGRGLP
jgi:DNA-binding transcriptional LysR family regulator